MTVWSDGYNADIAYTHGFYRDLAPGYLAYVCQLNGIRPPRLDRPFRYCELGCGQGLTLNILAASNPLGRFVGIDFNPLHVAGARRLAEEAGLTNVEFREQSFQDVAGAAGADAPAERFDIIALHGVYSWISPENRRAIVDILARLLNPGGIVYISYNALPGWAPLGPLQRLILAHAQANPARGDRQIDAALAFLNRLHDGGAGYFVANPAAKQHLDTLAGQDRRYLTHEYLNVHWEPLHHAQVAKDLEQAKLSYGCSAIIPLNIEELSLRPEMRAILAETGDPTLVETLRDFALNQVFRRDIFVRGPDRMGPRATMAALGRQRFTLTIPREHAGLAVPIPLGELRHDPSFGLPILDALAAGTPSLAEIAAMPALAGHGFDTLSRFVALLVSVGHAHPVAPFPEEARASAIRLNEAVTRRAQADEDLHFVAAPVIGTGAGADTVDRLALTGLKAGRPADAWELAGFAAEFLSSAGRTVLAEDGTPIAGLDPMRQRLAAVLDPALPVKLPLWRRIGVA